MRSRIVQLSSLLGLAVLVGGCEDPLTPDSEQVAVMSRIGPESFSLTSEAVSPTQVDLAWHDNSPNESGFEVHSSTDGAGGSFNALGETGINVTGYSDVGLTSEKEYCYKVRIFRTTGRKRSYSAFSNTSCATTPAIPPPPPPPEGPIAPSGTSARPPASNYSHTVEVTWGDNSADEDGFRVQRSGNQDRPWETVWTTGPNTTSAYIYGQPEEQQLCYRVVAFKGEGVLPSNVDCTYLPTGPTNLVANAVGTDAVDLTWSDNSVVEDGYDVERSETGDNPFILVATVEANSTAYRDAGVSVNTTYWYRVWAKRDGGRSGIPSTPIAAPASEPPQAPSEVNATPSSSTSASVGWTDNSSNEVGFRVERSQDGGGTWTPAGSASANYPAFFEGELPSEEQLCYRVTAFNGTGDSPPSSSDCTYLPKAPTELAGLPIDDQTIEYTWSDNSGVEDGYELWFFGDDGYNYYYYPIALAPNTTSHRASISESVYGVVALKDGGYSDWALLYSGEATAALQRRAPIGTRIPASAQRTPPGPGTR
jgi:hypothetical protein